MTSRTMPALTAAMLLAAIAQFSYADDKQGDYHLVILSGQSNMVGMKPELGFDQEAEKLFDRKVVRFKVASGGKPIRLWLDNWDEIAKKHKLDADALRKREKNRKSVYYAPIMKNYQETLKKHGKPLTVTFCWMQGERDAKEKLSAAYADSMKELISRIRKDTQRPDMAFVIGRLSDFGKSNNEHWNKVREVQVQVAKDDPKGAWVDCDDLNDKKKKDGTLNNDLHYTKEGYGLMGRRMVRQMKLMIDGKAPASNGRPE